jgi:hypothetical protein
MTTGTANHFVESVTDQAWQALQSAYDLQVHVAPDVIARRTDDVDLARDFLARGLKGFVLKSHYVPTAERARVVERAVPGIACFGGLTLNHSVGGFNPVAVEIAGRSGARIVWMPTVDAANETAGRPGGASDKLPFWASIQRELASEGVTPPPLSPLGADGHVTTVASQCLERIAKHDMILATGHLGRAEIFALVRRARDLGVQKIIVTHAEFPSQSLSGDEQRQLADLGAIIEHCFTTTHTNKAGWDDVFRNVRLTGTARTILSTDLGQTINPPVAEGFAMFAQRFLDNGFSVEEIHHMVAVLPARLLEH